jgi:hypothetical protein
LLLSRWLTPWKLGHQWFGVWQWFHHGRPLWLARGEYRLPRFRFSFFQWLLRGCGVSAFWWGRTSHWTVSW